MDTRELNNIPGIVFGFGTSENPIPFSDELKWETHKPEWKQVHGVAAAEVFSLGQACGEVDALYTRVLDTPIAVVTADCVPVLLARRDGGAVAAVHAGWRGTYAEILRAFLERLRSEGEQLSDWAAAIGPCIGPCCYEVSEELFSNFREKFTQFESSRFLPRHRHLDLRVLNELQLLEAGVSIVDHFGDCTFCTQDNRGAPVYHSFRREKASVRQYSVISRISLDFNF